MKSFEELINTAEPGWPLVSEWIKTAKNKIEVLPADAESAKRTLIATQITTRSPMGAIIYSSGGILVDEGWIRIKEGHDINKNSKKAAPVEEQYRLNMELRGKL